MAQTRSKKEARIHGFRKLLAGMEYGLNLNLWRGRHQFVLKKGRQSHRSRATRLSVAGLLVVAMDEAEGWKQAVASDLSNLRKIGNVNMKITTAHCQKMAILR